MKTILIAILSLAPIAAGAQKSCDELLGQAKEACLKQGGTVQASSAADAKKDYTTLDSKQKKGTRVRA